MRRIIVSFITAIFLFGFTEKTAAQTTIEFDQWTTAHGLSQVSVFAMMQDREGYLWFATENGLNQFDGYQFTHYTHSLFDSNSLSDQLVYTMIEDDEGIMWIACFGGGLNRFDRRTGQFTHYRHDPKNPSSISSDFVTTLYISPLDPKTLWVGTERGGLNRMDIAVGTFTNYKNKPGDSTSLCNDRIYALSGDDLGNVWAGTRNGLARFDVQKNSFTNFFSDHGNLARVSHNEIWHIFKDRDGLMWISTTNGLTRCEPHALQFTIFQNDPKNPRSLPHQKVWASCDDIRANSDYLWVGTNQGLARMNKKTGDCTIFLREEGNPRSLGHNQVWALYNDRQDNIWIGSFGGGVNRVNRSKEKFNHYHTIASDPNSIRHNEMWSLYEDRAGNIWAGHRKGIDVINMNGRRILTIDNENGAESSIKIKGTRAQSITEDAEENFWIGTDGAGLYRFDAKTKKLTLFQHSDNDPNSLTHDFVSYVYQSKTDRSLWICTNGGLNRLDPVTGKFTRYQNDPNNPQSISHDRVRFAAEDSDGNLWIGTYGGIDKMDRTAGTFTHHAHNPSDANSLSENRVWVIHEAQDGILWVGTHIGLNRMDRKNGIFKAYSVREGLPSNEIYGICEDNSGRLWISTSRGLSKLDPQTEHFTNYFEDDGLQSSEFNGAVFAQGRSGRMYFGGINGFTAFEPNKIVPASDPPPVIISSFRKFDQPVLQDRRLNALERLELPYSDNFFGFEFSTLNYHNVTKNQYRYKLEGFDPDWILSGNRRYATYTNLDPGNYQFRVIAANSDGVWNTTGSSIAVKVLPPWWKTWWFRLLAATAVIALVITIYRIRVERLLAIERMRTRIASDLHDDIGATLTRIAVGSEMIQASSDAEKMKSYAGRIGELSREVIRTFSDVVWSIDARNDKLGDLIARIQDTAYQVLSPLEIEHTFTRLGPDVERPIKVDIRQNLFLICKEAIHNIAKHSGANTVTISFEQNASVLLITIRDNGRGLPEKTREQGNGLRNMRLRAKRIGADISWTNDNGCILKLQCPLS
jgi:ligand-binding sensor domain-containing protein/signal transduction histidine kinase